MQVRKAFRFVLAGCLVLGAFAGSFARADSAVKPESDLLERYSPGIPQDLNLEWKFPTGFSLGINGAHHLRQGSEEAESGSAIRTHLFPFSFLMEYCLLDTHLFTHSVGLGMGPYLFHRGPAPLELNDLEITYGSSWFTEWAAPLKPNLRLNLKMKYMHALRSSVDAIPLGELTTWLGLDFLW
ncbi:MAG: hypothetical protein AB1640_14665 [bacterium]